MKGYGAGMLRQVAVAILLTVYAMAAAGSARAADKIAYRLKWLVNASVAGDVVADRMGFFGREGLSVAVKPGGPERDAIKELELGYAQFGVASADQVIRALSKGSPVVVIAQLFQVNPMQWIYRSAEIKLSGPADLKGLRIGVTFGGNDETIMRTVLATAGLSERDVRLFSVRHDYTPFYQRKVDLWPVYRNTQAIILADQLDKAGERVAYFDPADAGVRFVANSVVTSRKRLEQRPEQVRRFMRALLAGWRHALDPANETAVLGVLQEFDRNADPGQLARQLSTTRPLIRPTADFPIGRIDRDAWRQTETIMLDRKLIASPVHVLDHLHPVVTEEK